MTKSICFDVLGTCFGFDAVIAIIDRQLGLKFKAVQVDSKSFFFSWFYAAQRDFTYNSMVDNYVPIAQILMKTFRRACLIVDLPASDVKDEDISAVMESIKALTARPGLKLCYDSLREDGWDVYGVTNGAEETSLNYYRRADIDLGSDHMLSCDELKKAKPDYNVYQKATEVVAAAGCTGQQRWFVAAHSWDLIAARKAGFKTAYLQVEEHDPVSEVFGTFDLYADNFHELLTRLNALS